MFEYASSSILFSVAEYEDCDLSFVIEYVQCYGKLKVERGFRQVGFHCGMTEVLCTDPSMGLL